jgi:alkaline phosphatase D
VHYAAAHHYSPERARFSEFDPFWEFVAGPLHAATGSPKSLDNTFGPEVRFQKARPEGARLISPADGLQFYGSIRIEGKTGAMSVALKDLFGAELYAVTLPPADPSG